MYGTYFYDLYCQRFHGLILFFIFKYKMKLVNGFCNDTVVVLCSDRLTLYSKTFARVKSSSTLFQNYVFYLILPKLL